MKNQVLSSQKPHAAMERESRMRRKILVLSVLLMTAAPFFVNWVLTGLSAYIDSSVAVYAPSTLITVASYLLSYLISLLTVLYQYAGFGLLGYSVMRFGIKKSRAPILLTFLCAVIAFGGNIAEAFYLYGKSAILGHPGYFFPIWAINLFLSLFTCFCVFFLCATVRTSFGKKGRLAVSVRQEDRETRRHNALRRLYFLDTVLLFVLNLISSLLGTYAEVRKLGGPETVWEWISLVEPQFLLLLTGVIGYFTQLAVGRYLTVSDSEIGERLREEQFSAENDEKQAEILSSFR